MRITESTFNLALDLAATRGVLPSALGSAEQRRTLARSLRRGMVFSARVAKADYLTAIYDEVNRILEGGYESDMPAARLRLRGLLTRLQYTPETGFPGDAQLGIPPAEPGSLQDLRSEERLNLILETQTGIMRGAVARAQEMQPVVMKMFPWLELVRIEQRRVPRGSADSGSLGWPARWMEAAGPAPVVYQNQTRLIAPKNHHVWRNLGDSRLFDDALDVDHPPFAFRSGFGTRQIHWREGRDMGLELPDFAKPDTTPDFPPNVIAFPSPKASAKRIDPEIVAILKDLGPVKSTSDILRMQ
mgnify:CR=1 FL=1